MTFNELPADMETPVRALAMRLERRALEYNDRQGCYAYIGDDCALDDRAAQALQALLKAYQEQRRALEDANQSICAFAGPWAARFAADQGFPDGHLHPVHYDILEKAGAHMAYFTRAALNQKGDER